MLCRPVTALLLFPALFASVLRAEDTPAFTAALEQFSAKQYPEARTAFQILTLDEPANARARYYLGRIAMKRGDADDAILQFEKAVELDPGNSGYHAELGGAYGNAAEKASLLSQMSFAKKCRAALEHAVELDPGNLDARQGLVDYYRQAPSFLGGGLLKAYDQARSIRQRDLERGTLILGQLYFMDRRYDEAIDLAKELITAQPENYIGHYSIGRVAAESGAQPETGETHLRRCLELPPRQGDPSHAAVWWRLGNLAERRKDLVAARAAYNKSLELDPKFKQAADSLAKLP
ncbi:MAG: tetratricopeptide repeat protein [Opitutaceae bacterium]|nr:tetratricopeptide repeat protein [Opitutaceae bacterium]